MNEIQTTKQDVIDFLKSTTETKLVTNGMHACYINDLYDAVGHTRIIQHPTNTFYVTSYAGKDVYIDPALKFNNPNIYNEAGDVVFTISDPNHMLV